MNKPPPLKSLSEKLSQLTKGASQPEEVHKKTVVQHEQDNEEVPFDERWLMSYADKMTLLCGCFIMLFAISTIDPVRLKQLQKSTEKSFGVPTKKEEETVVDYQLVAKETSKNNEQLKEEVAALRAENESSKAQIQKISEEKKSIQESLQQLQSSQKTDVVNDRKKLLQKIEALSKSNDPSKINRMVKTIETLENEKIQLNGSVEDLQQKVMTKEKSIQNLERQLASLEEARNRSGFLAFVMSWPTALQDIDLYVTDPSGRTFDFKRRSYDKHPGLLVLDTRQGPGVEVWQSDQVIPGVYSFKYFFYNSYGNQEPCSVTGTLFTPKGKVSLPNIILNPQKKTEVLRFKIDQEGKATIL